MRISDWSSDVCSSDLIADRRVGVERRRHGRSQQRGNCQESEKGLTHFQTSLENQDHRSSLTACRPNLRPCPEIRSEEHTSELQSLMRNSYAVFCLKKKKKKMYII